MTNQCFPSLTVKSGWLLKLCLPVAVLFQICCNAGLGAPDYNQILGDWDSNYGPVHIDFKAKEEPAGSALVTGWWNENNHKGEIESGHYNAGTGEIDIAFLETWTKLHGKAKLKLNESGRSFSGSFKSEDGSTGTWTWTRHYER